MIVGTTYIKRDEYAVSLSEMDLLAPDFKSKHRYQLIYVIRDYNLAEYRTDLGPANSATPPFRIMGAAIDGSKIYFEHTVAELLDMADALREDTKRFKERLKELSEQSTLIPDIIDQVERNQRVIENKSVFGPGGSTQRTGFSKKGAIEYEHKRRARRPAA